MPAADATSGLKATVTFNEDASMSAQNTLAKSLSKNNVSKYIPSQKAANITKTYDNSGLKSAFDRADIAEENALKVLSGDFDKYQ